MTDDAALDTLYHKWLPLGFTTAQEEKTWDRREFGYYAPDGTAFFFYVGRS